MVVRVENSLRKSSGQISFYSNCSSSQNMHEEDSSESFSKHLSSTVRPSSPCCLEVKHLGPQPQDQELSSSQSTSQSQQEATMMGKPNSHEQCISSKMVQDESYEKHVQRQLRPAFLICNPDFCPNPSQLEMSQSSIHIPYAYSEAYFNGLFTACGPHAAVQPPMVGVAPGRVPLPADLAEDGPIYVNAKQYHGILRRRQIRAKLEAQNKLVKTRKPYLHESRHLHALNRVRGSGGRFVGSKKAQQSEATPSTSSSSECSHFHQNEKMSKVYERHQFEAAKHVDAPTAVYYGITQDTDSVVNFDQPNLRLSTLSSGVAVPSTRNGGLTRNGEQHGAPVIQ